jgi:Ca2+-transporting ATPase
MDGPPAQTLGIEGEEKDLMHRPPETGDILTRKTLLEIFISGIVMAIGTVCVFFYQISNNTGERKAMTVAFTLFVMYQLFNAYNRKASSSKPSTYLYLAIIGSFLLQLLIIYLPQLQAIFRTTSITMIDWAVIVVVAFTIVIAEKIMNRVNK